jgi:hypothetical protein
LDAFWARRPGTVKSNLTLMLRIVKVQEEGHGIPIGQMFRPQGPHPVGDTFRMMTAVVLLDHSLNAGINATTVQFNTIRKTRSAMSNYKRKSAPEIRHAALVGYKKGERLGFTNTSVYSLWFDRFIVGCHVRMGDDTMQDRAFSIELILAIQKLLEEDLLKCQSMDAMLNVSLHGVFLIAGCCGGLRGEELPLTSLDATAKYLSVAEPRSAELANVLLAFRGRVKGEALEEACHLVPIAAVTASVLTPRLWDRRDVEAYANLGISNGWMFRNKKGEAERMGFYEPYMFELIQRVQDAGTVAERLLPRDDDITVSHGISISGRRGYATHATNVGIADTDIKRLVRWRAIEVAAGRAASLPRGTKEGYSEKNQMIKSLLRASRPL